MTLGAAVSGAVVVVSAHDARGPTTAPPAGATAPRRTIAGTVQDEHGAPIAGAEVGASDLAIRTVKTDANGRFELSGVNTDTVALFALRSGFAPARAEAVARGSRNVVLILPAPASVRGALRLPAGSGRVLVSLCRSNNETGDELCVARRLYAPPAELYELDRLAPGNYRIVAELEGHPTLRYPIAILPGADIDGPLLAWP